MPGQAHDPGVIKRKKNLARKLSKSDKLSILIWSQLRDPKQKEAALDRYTKDQIKEMLEFRKQRNHLK